MRKPALGHVWVLFVSYAFCNPLLGKKPSVDLELSVVIPHIESSGLPLEYCY